MMNNYKKEELLNKIETMFPQKNYNCAQTVLLCVADYFGLSNEILKDISAPLGGGLCMTRVSVCGAVCGGIMAIGLIEKDNKAGAYSVGEKFLKYIDKKYESRNCDGILGIDFEKEGSNIQTDPSKLHSVCKPLVIDVCLWIIKEYDK